MKLQSLFPDKTTPAQVEAALLRIYQTGETAFNLQEVYFTTRARNVWARVRRDLSKHAELEKQLFSRGGSRWSISLRGDCAQRLVAIMDQRRAVRVHCTYYDQAVNTTYSRIQLR